MNKARRQAYLTLIESLLTLDSEEQTAILQTNLELLDDEFAEFLRDIVPKILAGLDVVGKADLFARFLNNLSIIFTNLQQGSRASNLEIAIICNKIALTVWTRDSAEQVVVFTFYLLIQNRLYQIASLLMQNYRNVYLAMRADTQNNLAIAYCQRIKGDRGDNLERAIAFYEAALQVYTRPAFPEEWADIQNNLANAYGDRIREDRGDNLETAIKFYEAALQVRTRAAFPEKWADTQNNLAIAYKNRIKGDRGDNLETAIKFFEAALQVYTYEDFPKDWATTQNNLANAYYSRIQGDRGDNLERAIKSFEAALQVLTRPAFPETSATIQNNLANAYRDRIQGDRGDNLETAIKFFEAALQVYTRTAFPERWAMTQHNLAAAYSNRIKGDTGDNLETAIKFYEAALQVCTRDAFPQNWAMIQHNLAAAYSNRIKGDTGDNLEIAIKFYQAALQVYTPTTLPLNCLLMAQNLGDLGFDESLWETAIFGYEKAIQSVEQTREWVTSPSRKRQLIEENLNIYEKMMQSCINHQQYHKAIQTVERSKSRYLVELFTNSEIYPKTATESEKQQLRNLRSQIAASQQFLETQSSSPTPTPPLTKGGLGGVPEDFDTQRATQTRTLSPESLQQQKDKLETTLQQLEQLLQQIKQREPEFTLTQKVEPINIAEFQQTLDPETAIVEWYIGNPKFNNQDWGGAAFIITRNQIDLIQITATELAELETWKNDYLNEYRDQAKQKIWQQTLSAKLHKLSEILRLNEIIAKIPKHCHQLILVPHRYLHLFPLHALPFTSQTRFTQETMFRGNLLDCFPSGVKYAPSLQLLQLVQNRIQTRTSPAPELQPLFAIQNPTEDLKNADMEVQIIKQRFDTHDILIKQQATKIAFKENLKNLSNASYIHFSCHGLFNFDDPLLSLLVLADSIESIPEINPPQPPLAKGGLESEINPPQPPLAKGGLQDDNPETPRYVTMRSGRKAMPEKCLTLREIFANLELSKCNLVTLSACETGLTSSTEMTDEYIGLPSGFLYAGSMNVVSTLWSVHEFETAILMIRFYQELLHQVSVAVALNAAQNWMRAVSKEDFGVWVKSLSLDKESGQRVELWLAASTEEQPFSDPIYWAAFCATGY
ncbi:CHAT domain-containing protein [Microcoleus sp. bin38.metabat.b11b12b14.051]|uniref:CHAT domain-containing protein n=1 Tax=Microcoleus sp. bin38.metabat.b11b12b14.051 TaxID=2742709 RepID=UPI0025E7C49B|nr:CHAT domain-containing tetratricopeptide repeat protein [Microcoleus sp. bin38.metabat.b11b12b14.051]